MLNKIRKVTPKKIYRRFMHMMTPPVNLGFSEKIKLEHNIPLTQSELNQIDQFCDIMNAVKAARSEYIQQKNLNPNIAMPNGLVWKDLNEGWGGSWGALRNKIHKEINVFRIQGNVFSDRATVVYQDDELIPDPNEWDYRYLDMAKVMPEKWRVRLPARFGEIGWNLEGYPVNWTTTTTQERINLIYLSGICNLLESRQKNQTVRCLEVGGGCGEMGYSFSKALPGITWYDCDLPESLIHNVIYLATILPEKKHYIYTGNLPLPAGINKELIITDPKQAALVKNAVVSIPNFLIDDLEPYLTLDFAFNTWSFSEMSALQATHYGNFIKTALKNTGIMLEQNIDLRNMDGANYCKIHFADIFPHRHSLVPEAHQNYLQSIKLYGGEVDIWGNVDLITLLKPYSNKINKKKIVNSMWRKCGRPWAFNGAPHLRDLFTKMTLAAFDMSEKKITSNQ